MKLKNNYGVILQNPSLGLLFPKNAVEETEREMQRVSQYIAAPSGIKHGIWHMTIACADPEDGRGSRPQLENHKYI